MVRLIVICLLFVLDLSAQEICSVKISGNKRIDTEAVLGNLKSGKGSLNRELVSSDIKALYATGFFSSVEANLEPDTNNCQIINYSVKEKPIVRKVYIKGNQGISEDDLDDILTFGDLRFIDKAIANQVIKKATTYYQSRGYYDASFEYDFKAVGDEQIDITFKVTEGERYKIKKVEIEGLSNLSDSEIKDLLQTKKYKWWSSWLLGSGRLNEEVLKGDQAIIQQYLLNQGYVDAKVSEAVIDKQDGKIFVKFDVNEGPEYKFGKIRASGDLVSKSEKTTLDDLSSETGETFSAEKLRADVYKIADRFADLSYAFANVVPDTQIDRVNKKVDIQFQIDKGQPVKINEIKIIGNDKTYDNVIRRELKVHEQDPYSKSKIERSKRLLNRLGYFEDVNITTENLDRKDAVDLAVNVREAATGSFSAGAGYSTTDGVIFSSQLSENNLLGTGRKVSLSADIGSRRDNISLGLDDRRFLDSNFAVGTDIFRTNRQYQDFDRGDTGASASLGYPLEEIFGEWSEDMSVGLKYQFVNVDISDVDPNDAAQFVIDSQGKLSAGSLTPKIVRNTIDNPLNPSTGSNQVISFEHAGVGGDAEYYVIEARNAWYYPLIKKEIFDLVFSWRTNLAYGQAPDNEKLPLFRRYFPGGINSVRGFQNRTLGPKDEKGNEFGGAKQFVNNFELIFPLISSAGLKGIVFYDVGQAFDDEESIDLGLLRKAYGTGIRWNSPIGPLRLEFGLPVAAEEGEDSFVTSFSFGAPL